MYVAPKLNGRTKSESSSGLESIIKSILLESTGVLALDVDFSFSEMGVNSLQAIEFRTNLQADLGLKL